MAGNSFGSLFKVTTFGESHGDSLGVVIDGIPPKLSVNLQDLKNKLARRSPGRHQTATSRQEADEPALLSGVFQNKTLGTPIAVIVKNTNQKSEDYQDLKNEMRPGHADQTTLDKYGIRDHRGGGRASGRETVSRVIAGYFARLVLPPELTINTFISKIGKYHFPAKESDSPTGYFYTPKDHDKELTSYLLDLKNQGESCGGEVTVYVQNVPKGLGDPVFDKLKSTLAHALLSIGSCLSFEVGLGAECAHKLGSEISQNKQNFGGIEGGISNGETMKIKLSFKAPSTIGEKALNGRHDPCILPRVLVVIESMIEITLADHFLKQRAILPKTS